jgi:CRISPR-associated protein Cas2
MELLVAYDVATDTREGRRRLRRVALVCQAFGQRVQQSVFECSVSPTQQAQLIDRLLREIEPAEDSLRIYRLREPRERYLHKFGVEPEFDLHDPLVI